MIARRARRRRSSDFDVLVSPTSPTVAFQLGAQDRRTRSRCTSSDVLTIPSNMAGPAGALDPVRAVGGPAGRLPADRAAVLREHALPRRARARAGDRVRLRPGAAGEMTWEPVIGLEIHVHLKTRTKMFCRCEVAYFEPAEHAAPARSASPTPASLPVPNEQAVEWTIKLGLALELRDRRARGLPPQELLLSGQPEGLPDLPVRRAAVPGRPPRRPGRRRGRRGRDRPRAPRGGRGEERPRRRRGGADRRRRARRSSTSTAPGRRWSRSSRSPTCARPTQARRFLQLLRQTVVELGISDAEMEKGSLRFDVNVSVRPEGSDELRTRTELKNMNSFAFAAQGDRARGRAADRASTRPAARSSRRRSTSTRPHESRAAAALEGGGAGLPLLPRARPRADRAARRAGRACPRRAAELPGAADPPPRGGASASRPRRVIS